MTQRHNITLQSFDDAVQAAFGAWSDVAGLRLFFARTRKLLHASNVNLVIWPGQGRRTAFGIHEADGVDLVPEMMRSTGTLWKSSLRQTVSRSQCICMGAFQSSAIYRRYYSPYGLLHGASRRLTLADTEGRLVIDRAATEIDFNAEELDVIDRLAANLERTLAWHDGNASRSKSRWWLRSDCIDAEEDNVSGIERAAASFGLTPAELRLVQPLSRGSGLQLAARELGISLNTAKSRLRSVFEKTGTHRQAELVSLLLGSRQ